MVTLWRCVLHDLNALVFVDEGLGMIVTATIDLTLSASCSWLSHQCMEMTWKENLDRLHRRFIPERIPTTPTTAGLSQWRQTV